jgi:hypothetical protein
MFGYVRVYCTFFDLEQIYAHLLSQQSDRRSLKYEELGGM